MSTDVQTYAEYQGYVAAVSAFFDRNGIEHGFSIGSLEAWDCGSCGNTQHATAHECKDCGAEYPSDPHFSWRPCDCCGGTLGGDRQDVVAWCVDSAGNKELCEFTVCVDCYYFAEYGKLDDSTMMKVEQDMERTLSGTLGDHGITHRAARYVPYSVPVGARAVYTDGGNTFAGYMTAAECWAWLAASLAGVA